MELGTYSLSSITTTACKPLPPNIPEGGMVTLDGRGGVGSVVKVNGQVVGRLLSWEASSTQVPFGTRKLMTLGPYLLEPLPPVPRMRRPALDLDQLTSDSEEADVD
jgi:hypothetical protein